MWRLSHFPHFLKKKKKSSSSTISASSCRCSAPVLWVSGCCKTFSLGRFWGWGKRSLQNTFNGQYLQLSGGLSQATEPTLFAGAKLKVSQSLRRVTLTYWLFVNATLSPLLPITTNPFCVLMGKKSPKNKNPHGKPCLQDHAFSFPGHNTLIRSCRVVQSYWLDYDYTRKFSF